MERWMIEMVEIEIPESLVEPLLRYAAETEHPVEEIVEKAIRRYMKIESVDCD